MLRKKPKARRVMRRLIAARSYLYLLCMLGTNLAGKRISDMLRMLKTLSGVSAQVNYYDEEKQRACHYQKQLCVSGEAISTNYEQISICTYPRKIKYVLAQNGDFIWNSSVIFIGMVDIS